MWNDNAAKQSVVEAAEGPSPPTPQFITRDSQVEIWNAPPLGKVVKNSTQLDQ